MTMPLKRTLRALLPTPLLSLYHFLLSLLAAIVFGFPSRRISVIAVTGTKGKSSTLEYLNAIFEAAGEKTALASTIRVKIGERSEANTMRMTMAGRFFLQQFLADAVKEGCSVALIEMTSEGARQHRHRFIALDALIFTHLTPEHIESHGSLQAYADAKFEIGRGLARSSKRPRYMVANAVDGESLRYLRLPVEHALPFSLGMVAPWKTDASGGTFTFDGTEMRIRIPGAFSIENAAAAAVLTRAMGVKLPFIAAGLDRLSRIPGRAEEIREGQPFTVVVDYAHTAESLRAIYAAYPGRRIAILGATGGGRDMWKRPVMGRVAEEDCAHVILTNEDPYDEDPRSIIDAIARGMHKETHEIVIDRREAIRRAFEIAQPGDTVLITGKGTDPSICGPRGTQIPWSDAVVAREELRRITEKPGERSAIQ
jgi:UDP-N-acetylmuramoyl-L-alanyl-D-glutamate--2,6-diaminopimelate ligase